MSQAATTGISDIREERSFKAYKREHAHISRKRLYPATVFYTSYAIVILMLALRSPHHYIGLAFFAGPVSFIVPIYTLSSLLAGMMQFYVFEEWIHHSTRFYDLGSPYFRYIKRRHGYHQASTGTEFGYGLTNGFWNVTFNTHYQEAVRKMLYGTTWSPSLWRSKQKPLYGLDRAIAPIVISEPETGNLTSEAAVETLLKHPEAAKVPAAYGAPRGIIQKMLARFREYGLTAVTGGRLTIPVENRLRAYVAA